MVPVFTKSAQYKLSQIKYVNSVLYSGKRIPSMLEDDQEHELHNRQSTELNVTINIRINVLLVQQHQML